MEKNNEFFLFVFFLCFYYLLILRWLCRSLGICANSSKLRKITFQNKFPLAYSSILFAHAGGRKNYKFFEPLCILRVCDVNLVFFLLFAKKKRTLRANIKIFSLFNPRKRNVGENVRHRERRDATVALAVTEPACPPRWLSFARSLP